MTDTPLPYAVERPQPVINGPPRVRAVVSEVAAKYGCTVADILGQRRSGRLSIARFEVCARLRELNYGGAPPSLPLIGRWLQRHHTTVLHAIRRHAQRMGEGA